MWAPRLAIVVAMMWPAIAVSHDHWIANGSYKSPIDGSHCCGVGDCDMLDKQDISRVNSANGQTAGGYLWRHPVSPYATDHTQQEFIPDAEVQDSRDGEFYRCRKPDGSRRCFFAPPKVG